MDFYNLKSYLCEVNTVIFTQKFNLLLIKTISIMKKSTLKFFAIAMFFLMGTYVMAQTQFSVEFIVDMTDAETFNPDTDDIYMSGTFAGWAEPGSDVAYKMEPLDVGSMFYTLTATIDEGEVMYKYFRVIDGVTSWDNGEWTGDPNRKVFLTGETMYENVWANKPHDITFTVDMTPADPFNPATDDVYIAGSLANGWAMPGSVSAYMMTPLEVGSMFYTITLLLYPGDEMFKYFRVIDGVASWDNGEWTGDPNREVTVDTVAAIIENEWGDLVAGIFTEPNIFTYSMYPNPAITLLNIDNTSDVSQIDVYDVTGKLARTVQLDAAPSVSIDVAELQAGVYIINVYNKKGVQTSKFVKN